MRFTRLFGGFGLCLAATAVAFGQSDRLRPPAVPLVTSDPYLSIWSEADRATDDVTRHWTRHPHPLVSLIKIDGDNFRILGNSPSDVPALPQTSLEVTATRTSYVFKNPKVSVRMSFLTPALPNKLDWYGRPVTYLRWEVKSNDGASHSVQVYDSVSSLLSVESPTQKVQWKHEKFGDLTALSVGTVDQTLFRPAGDDTRIDWGYAYAVAPVQTATNRRSQWAIGGDRDLKNQFLSHGLLSGDADPNQPRASASEEPVMSFSFDLGQVKATPSVAWMMIGYDEVYSIDYFGQKLRPYWRRNGAKPADLFRAAERDYKLVWDACDAFDKELTQDATKVGGDKYAQILALSYRECVAANGFAADSKGAPLLLTKENTSNGDIATVDVIFPMDPIWIFLSPTLAKASLVSNFMYAASNHWKFPNAPHDLGTYPQVFGRDDGGEGMPVEESGNMILLTDAVAHDENSVEFASKFWPQLTQWAKYLEKFGLDPEDQLCTDDFMGHLAHNANLSVKAILALGAYADLCKMKGDVATASRYKKLAQDDAAHWVQVADEGDHSLLAFDKPGTWSQKYNLVWDQLLGLKLFPADVRQKEVAYYREKLLPYGVPLDSRTHLTKTDWSIWSATLADGQADFEALIDPIYSYLSQTTTRDPIADSYETDKIESGGMHARPVVGGFFVKMLSDPEIWKKWVAKDHERVISWAPLPSGEKLKEIVPSGQTSASVQWKYTTSTPGAAWNQASFDDGGWSTGTAGFGSDGTPAIKIGTKWTSGDIWMRRAVKLPRTDLRNVVLHIFHDEDVEVYVDGVPAASEAGYISEYETLDIQPAAKALMKPGATVVLAVHCHQTEGGQGVDVGFAIHR